MDAFTENLKRHIADQGRAIGGTYGRQPMPLNGWHPAPKLDLFVDGTILDSTNPATPQWFNDPAAYFNVKKNEYSYTTSWLQEVILAFQNPVTNLSHLAIRCRRAPQARLETYPLSIYSFQYIRAALRFNLIKYDILSDSSDPLYYQSLTWDNAKYDYGAGAHGTLYDTAANYDDNSGEGYRLFPMYTQAPENKTGGVASLDLNGTESIFADNDFFAILRMMQPTKTETYYGVHLYFADIDGSGDVVVQPPKTDANWYAHEFTVSIRILPAVNTNVTQKSFGMEDGFF